MELVRHDPVIARELAHLTDKHIAQQRQVPAGQRLQPGDGLGGELVRLKRTRSSGWHVNWVDRLKVDDKADVDPVQYGVEGLPRRPGMHEDGVEQVDLPEGGGLVQRDGALRAEERAHVGADGERVPLVDGGDRVWREVEHLGRVLAVGEQREGVRVDGEQAAEGLDVEAPLHGLVVGGDGAGADRRSDGGAHRRGVVEVALGALELGVQLRVHGRLRHHPRAVPGPRRAAPGARPPVVQRRRHLRFAPLQDPSSSSFPATELAAALQQQGLLDRAGG